MQQQRMIMQMLLTGWILLLTTPGLCNSLGLLQRFRSDTASGAVTTALAEMNRLVAEERYAAAGSHADRLIASHGRDAAVREAFYVRGLAAERAFRFPEALEDFSAYLAFPATSVHTARARRMVDLIRRSEKEPAALALFLQGEWAMAEEQYLRAVRLFHSVGREHATAVVAADALNGLAYVRLVYLRDPGGALTAYTRLLATYPESAYRDNALYGKARALELEGRQEEARAAYGVLRERNQAFLAAGISVPGFDPVTRLWHRRATLGLARLERSAGTDTGETAAPSFRIGMGDRLVVESPAGSRNWQRIWNVLEKDAVAVDWIEFTVNGKTNVSWENRQEVLAADARGYGLMVIFQYFDEELSPAFVQANEAKYYQFIDTVLIPLLEGTREPYILLEAEFNRGGVGDWAGWNDVAIQAIERIRKGLPAARVGLTVGDWNLPDPSGVHVAMERAAPLCDFIGYQLMVSRLEESADVDPVGAVMDRAMGFAAFLGSRFQRPVLLGYTGVSTVGGWETLQESCIAGLFHLRSDLMHQGVLGMVQFTYQDDPGHGGWFGKGEQQFGLVRADGSRKPGWTAFRDGAAELMAERETLPPELKTFKAEEEGIDLGKAPWTAWITLNRPTEWEVQIKGVDTGALRTFRGKGLRFPVVWDGTADRGRFAAESCEIVVHAIQGKGRMPLFRQMVTVTNPAFETDVSVLFDDRFSGARRPDTESGILASGVAFSGAAGLRVEWFAKEGGKEKSLSLIRQVAVRKDMVLEGLMRVPDGVVDGFRIGIRTERGLLFFDPSPYWYRDAGNGWFRVRIPGSEILKAAGWKDRMRPDQILAEALVLKSLTAPATLFMDEIRWKRTAKGEAASPVRYHHQLRWQPERSRGAGEGRWP